jgi:hypothetical protein
MEGDSLAQAETPADQPAPTAAQPVTRDRWQLSVEPYFFVPLDVKADITAAGRSASLKAGLKDILSLDRSFDAGLRVEARKNRFGVMFDGFYLSAGQSGNLGVTFPQGSLQNLGINSALRVSADASVSFRQGTIDLAGFYRVLDRSLNRSAPAANPYPRLVIDPFLGLRTNILNQEIEVDRIRIGNQIIPIDRDFSVSRTTLEPLLGARFGLELSDRWSLGVRGDVSGFNINADRDTTWNILAGVRYRLSPSTSLQLAYSFKGFDLETGEGLKRAEANLRQQGLWLSVLFQF